MADRPLSLRSRIGLDSVNFFQAEAVGVVIPVLNEFLRDAHWSYSKIGIATSVAGLGTLLFQTPAGWLVDKLPQRRALFLVACMLTAAGLTLIPWLPQHPATLNINLFVFGVVQSIFGPLLAALALVLVGRRLLPAIMGENQGWNHAGNILAAILGIIVVRWGPPTVLYTLAGCSIIAGLSVLIISPDDMDESRMEDTANAPAEKPNASSSWIRVFRDPTVLAVLIAVALFHLANAPVMPMTALYIKKLGGSNAQATAVVLSAQAMMVPVAWLSGKLCNRWGRKPIFAIAFWFLPVRIACYPLTHSPDWVVVLQALDGVGAGIFGVVIAVIAADLNRHCRFSTLIGLFATAQGIGGVIGPLVQGRLTDRFGFGPAFFFFATVGLAAALVFQIFVPETMPRTNGKLQPAPA
jgi:MFS family permease